MKTKKILKNNSVKLLEVLYIIEVLKERCQHEAGTYTLLNVIYRNTKSTFFANEKMRKFARKNSI